jgi:hypothetical protein
MTDARHAPESRWLRDRQRWLDPAQATRPRTARKLEVKGLALPELMIEIELEAHKSR